jgi:hypothetical protein
MPPTTHHLARGPILLGLTGVILAAVVYVLTADVVWTIVPLLVTLAVVRRLLRKDGTDH